MNIQKMARELKKPSGGKIVMLVGDGLGGLPQKPGGPTELEAAATPHLDKLAGRGASGMMYPIAPGITPGSGPGHLGLFGYDPIEHLIGRGALEATGIGMKLEENDVAIRCNFCTLDADGNISDRRAGRIPTEESAPLADMLNEKITIDGVEVIVKPVKEHRFVVVFRAEGLGDNVDDTDPQRTGVPPLPAKGEGEPSQRTAKVADEFVAQATKLLADQPKANGLTMRGFSKRPQIDTFEDVYGLKPAAIASYPMYRGLAQLVGMHLVGEPSTIEEEVDLLEKVYDDYDFFFVHFKYTDSRGEDGDFDAKVKATEKLDSVVPRIEALNPSVLIVTGDHSTPAKMASHSWHAVPVLLAADTCRFDGKQAFSEKECRTGELGHFNGVYLMPLALAHAERLEKYGA